MTKNEKIKETHKITRERRKSLVCKVFKLKLNHLSKKDVEKLNKAFREAKWIYNDILSSEDIFNYEAGKNVKVKTQDGIEIREVSLGSQIKQSLVHRAKQNVINLAKAKSKGVKVGGLNFKKEVNSIPLKQYGCGKTYYFHGNIVAIQRLGRFKVRGMNQLSKCEYANANLIKSSSGFFLYVTVFIEAKEIQREGFVGVDFGIKDSIILSDGRKFNWEFSNKDIKRKHRILSKKKFGSRNYAKAKKRLKRSYEKYVNKKDDVANKFVSELNKYEKVVIQNENLAGWQSGFFGKKIQSGILGRIKSRIENSTNSIVVGRYEPTTKICPACLIKNDMPLSQRYYRCDCGFYHPCRDVKAARTILTYGWFAERKRQPMENEASFLSVFNALEKPNSMKWEASLEVVHNQVATQ